MQKTMRLPLRFKMLVTILLMIFTVTSTITYLMASIFHDDKASYINDLTSTLALNISEEVNTTITGYRDRLLLFTRLIYARDISQEHKSRLVKQIFEDFQEFVAISISEEGIDPVYIYDLNRLKAASISKEDLRSYQEKNRVPASTLFPLQGFVENSTITQELPSLSLSILHNHPDTGKPVIITAVISLNKLFTLTSISKGYQSFIIDSRDKLLIHNNLQHVVNRVEVDWIPDMDSLRGGLSKSTTIKLRHGGETFISGFAPTAFGNLLVGVQIPENVAFLTAREFLNRLLLTSFMFLVAAAGIGLILSRQVTSPLEKLARATREIAKGNFLINIKRESRDEIGDLTESFNKMAEELDYREKALAKAEELATRDGLTGLYNHRHFQESLAKELTRSTRHKLQFSLIFLDLDHFKNYNDTNGHLEGDFLLKELSRIVGERLRGNDILARYGGEEFVIILPETTKEEGGRLAEELRLMLEEHPFPGDEKQPLGTVTASMGVSSFPEDGKTAHEIIDRADQLLYKAKGQGRNTVCL